MDDLKEFKRLTTGGVVVMGRYTWESLPIRPLRNRTNIVISTSLKECNGCIIISDMDQLLKYRNTDDSDTDWFIIGGATLYNYFLYRPYLISNVYWTLIRSDYDCDVRVSDRLGEWLPTKYY